MAQKSSEPLDVYYSYIYIFDICLCVHITFCLSGLSLDEISPEPEMLMKWGRIKGLTAPGPLKGGEFSKGIGTPAISGKPILLAN